mgnify:CR=1 FL=1
MQPGAGGLKLKLPLANLPSGADAGFLHIPGGDDVADGDDIEAAFPSTPRLDDMMSRYERHMLFYQLLERACGLDFRIARKEHCDAD